MNEHCDKRVIMSSFFSVLARIILWQPHHPQDFQGQAKEIYIGPQPAPEIKGKFIRSLILFRFIANFP